MLDVDQNARSVTEERVVIPGPRHTLEGVLAYPDDATPSWAALIAGPHPFLGGDLQNNLVRALLTGLASRGGLTLAFHYAGVGKSEGGPDDWPATMSTFWQHGCCDEESQWREDTHAAVAALGELTDRPRVLIGYSFGCWTVAQTLIRTTAAASILISPNPRKHDWECLRETDVPLLVLHGDNDFTCTIREVGDWYDRLRKPKSFVRIEGSEHFFRGQERVVLQTVMDFVRSCGIVGEENNDAIADH